MAPPGVDNGAGPWAECRARAELLLERYPFASEVLRCYLALLDVWRDAWDFAREDQPDPRRLASWAALHVLPRVVKATEAAGPEPLGAAAREAFEAGTLEPTLAAWLAGGELAPVERYLSRASLWAPLMALGADAGAACADDPSPRGGRRCPRCGGPPQVSFRGQAEDRLVSGRRQLACARCGNIWSYSASTCPACGETAGARRTIYTEQRAGPIVGRDEDDSAGRPPGDDGPIFPHLRVDACSSCERYLIDVDLGRETRAVPEVDELAALPLGLYAADHGLSKIAPNLMGF
jgi:FdhE protein